MHFMIRPPSRRLGVAVSIAVAVLLSGAIPVQAAKLFRGQRMVIAETDTIHDDVYVSGGNLTVRGVIDGDVVMAGGQLGVNGVVTGSVLACGGQIEIYGDVAGSVRAAGGKLNIGARIGHDLVAAGGQIEILPDAHIGRDALLGGGRVVVDGGIDRNAKIGVGQLTLGRQATIGGDLDYASDRDAIRMSGAAVKGKTTWYASDWGRERKTPMQRQFIKLWMTVRFAIGLIMLGLLFALLSPIVAQRSIERLATQPLPSVLIGLITFIGMPVASGFMLLLGIMIGGWWLGGFMLAAWMIGMLLGVVVTAMTFGRWLSAKWGARGVALGWALVVGAGTLVVVRMIPFVGAFVVLVSTVAGLGALAAAVGAAISAGRKASRILSSSS